MEKRLRRTMNKSLKTVLFFPVCLLLLLLNDIQAAIAENDINVTCQEGWTKLHRGCYKFVEEETTWTDAVEKCQSVNAELSVLLSQTEKDDVEQYLISNDEINYKRWWVGLTREENTGSNWIWTERDNTRIDTKITPWFQNSQSTKKGELSATIELNSGRLVLRSDFRDDQEVIYPFICEFHKVTPRPTTNKITESDDTSTTSPFKESDSTDSSQKLSSYSSGSKSSTPTGSARGKLSAKTSKAHNSTSTSGTTTTARTLAAEATTAILQTKNLTTQTNVSKSPIGSLDYEEAAKMYERCYIPGTGGSQMERVVSAREFYKAGSQTCPQTRASSYAWEETREGKTAQTYCSSGEGFATWPCINNGNGVTCWNQAPDVKDCASKKIKAIIQNLPENNSVDVQQTIAVSAELVTLTQSENITFEDILLTSQIMSAYAMKVDNIQNASEVKTIVDNFAKVGSTLVSEKTAKVWKKMSPDDKVRSASTLLVAMENATLSLVEKIKEPKVITTKTDNIDLRLEVVDVTKMEQQELVYESNSDFATVSIPKETLVNQSEGSLAKVVFITHYSMSSLLGGLSKKKTKEKNLSGDDETDDKSKEESNNEKTDKKNSENEVEEIQSRPRIASYILSASLRKDGHSRKLPKPITFTMRLTEEMNQDQIALCSFWNISNGESAGFWSQDGCQVVASQSHKNHTTCQCDHMTSFAIMLDTDNLKLASVIAEGSQESTVKTQGILEVNTTTESETTTEKGTSGKCQETTENGIIFDETSSGNEVTTQCPSGYTGYVKKKCTKQAVWEDGQFSNCTRNILDTLFSSLNGTLNQDSLLNISKTLQETFKDVGQTILSGDIKNVVNIFRDLVDKTKLFKLTVPKVVVEVLTATIDNLLAASNSSWTEISTDGNQDDTGAEMIHSLESFTQSFLQTDQHSFSDISVRKDNIVLEIKQTTSDSIHYPDPTNNEGGKLQESKNEILFSQPAKENMKYSILEFKGMTSKFQTVKINKDFDYGDSASASKTILLNSDVISFSLEPKRQVDALKSNPLRLTFQITNHTLYRQFCVFMTKDLSWSTSGCTTKRTQANQVQCTCTHLSTFAVLMSPDVNEITTEATAKVQNCKEVIENGVIFKDTQPGKSVTAQCPEDYDGNSIKKCSIQGKWEKTNNNLCVPKVLQKVSQEAENLTYLSTPKEIENMTATVANVYKENKTIISGDIRKVVDIFAKIGAATTQYKIDVTNTTVQNITVTIDKLLSTNENDWKVVSLEDDVSAKLLLSVENITKSVLDSNTNVTEISLNKDNIAVEIKQKTVNEIIYPDPKKSQEERRNITENKIQLSQETSETLKYSIIIYKNVTEKFTIKNFIDDKVDKDQNNKQPTSKFLNSDVISFSVEPEPKSLQTNPLILTFKIRNTTGVRHVCAYLTNDSSWATDGCDTKVNKENVTCTCTHLTNFAVLMSPHAVKDTHREVLRFISAVGIVISLIGLAVTIAVYGIMWRYVKSDRSVLHVNLSVALFLGYTVFLVGIDRTHDFITCAIIAGSLHFLFLVVFFVMLAQGLLILKSVTTVSSTSILKFLFILMYGGPLLVVVLSVAITQGEGYGTKYVCWLDNSKGLIWAFAGPAFLVLVSNVVILIHVLRVMQSSRRMMDKDLKKKTMSVFRSISILTPILGITWLFGILSISIDNVLFQYLFAISNSLQGLFIFICQCVLQYQVRDGFRSMIRKYRATTSFDSSSKGASSCQDKGYSESLLQTTEPSNFFENATYDSTVVTSENQL